MSNTSVWDTLASKPGELDNLKVRSELMMKITRTIKDWDLTQHEAANRIGITQPRLNDLLTGKIDKFSLDALVLLAEPCGLKLTITVSEKTPE